MADTTIGIVGVGNVGSKVAAACKKLGMRLLLNDPPREDREGKGEFVGMEVIRREADFITFHTPLTRLGKHPTSHLADEDFFEGLLKKPFIMNAARGGVVCNQSLTAALKEKKIRGAVIDCWEHEPHISGELLKLADIATPHIAGYSADGKWVATNMSIKNLIDFFELKIKPEYIQIPDPEIPIIDLQTVPAKRQLAHAVWHTYKPLEETKALKALPDVLSIQI